MIRSLQVLRFIAAAGVVYYHTHASPSFGGSGVDIFFVLSGFIIAMLLEDPRPALHFAKGRIARIVPLYWAVTLFVFVLALAWPALYRSTVADMGTLLRSLFFVPTTQAPLLQVGWTLNYEMFFYAVAFGCKLFGLRNMALAAVLVAIFGAASLAGLDFLRNSRLLEFVLGIVVLEVSRRWKPAAAPAVAVLLVGFALLIVNDLNDPSASPLLRFGLPAALIVWASVSLERYLPEWVWPLVLLGDASYAVYLTHTFVVVLYDRFVPAGILTALMTVIAANAVGLAAYWLVDRPLSRYARHAI